MALELASKNDQVNAVIAERRRVAEAKERQAIADDFARQDEADLQKREAFEQRAEAAVAEWAAKSGAAISVEFMNRRISIRMNHRDRVVRDIARNAAHLLSQAINRMIGEGVIIANNTGRADAFTVAPDWIERLLDLDLRHAHERGMVTVTDLKGKPLKLKKLTTAPAAAPVGRRDSWLNGRA